MTAQHALHGERGAGCPAMALERFERIMRAGRVEPALAAHERAQDELVRTHQPHQDVSQPAIQHCCSSTQSSNQPRHSWRPGSTVGCRTRNIKSSAGKAPARRRNASRITRFARLRSCACGTTRFGTMSPRRACAMVLRAARSCNWPRDLRRPGFLRMLWNDAGVSSRCCLARRSDWIKQPDAYDLSRGGHSAPCGRRW